jgi:hypothetical protein
MDLFAAGRHRLRRVSHPFDGAGGGPVDIVMLAVDDDARLHDAAAADGDDSRHERAESKRRLHGADAITRGPTA